ncbi:helix-turn-helix transcriptional regulator [Actinoplanes sp. N902-109]|uniref:helix-turn-helix transcriptional regulator n=1 Tax=Actinoplanes sp. (strain N902-109) TaxID=649831 RepID=UPI00032957FA|nr:helix-turn-helix transcriptional regulator [Actinoplanes sp. N902-109]AGL13772.1 erythropoiesis-stimulating protein [Actinoplanes sp. N902-109]
MRSAFDRLAGLALIRRSDDEISPPTLNDPSAALSALLAREQVRIAQRQLQIEESRAAIAELLAAGVGAGQGLEDNDIERVVGLAAVRERISELAAGCTEEVWTFNPDGAQSEQNRSSSRPLNEKTLERGVRMRAIYLDSVRNDPATVEHLQWLTDQGAEVRTTLTLPIRMIIVDRATAVVPIDDRASNQGAIVITGRGMVAGLVALFVSTWKSAQPLSSRRSREPGQPNAQERAALRLWAQGATDASVARTLGISERTVRRISETIAERLRARSRFEAGARAMDVGWLSAEDLI